jgi:pyridoxine/pyridoxamine 5'-phosphate oxidase
MTKKTTAKKIDPKKTAPKKIARKKTAPIKATTSTKASVHETKGPAPKNLDIYGAKPLPWSRALKELESNTAGTYWLATTNPDGRPHVVAIGALWVDGKVYFTSNTRTRKGRNLAAKPDCVLSISLAGIDVVVEGTAVRITDRPTLLRLAKRYADQGWPASVSGEALTAEYSAPSAGPPPWNLYVVRPITAFGVATAEPSGATRWRFDQGR